MSMRLPITIGYFKRAPQHARYRTHLLISTFIHLVSVPCRVCALFLLSCIFDFVYCVRVVRWYLFVSVFVRWYFVRWMGLGKQVEVGVPDEAGRRDILRLLLRKLPCPFRRGHGGSCGGSGGGSGGDSSGGSGSEMKGAGSNHGGEGADHGADEGVDEGTVAAVAASSHGFVGADLQVISAACVTP